MYKIKILYTLIMSNINNIFASEEKQEIFRNIELIERNIEDSKEKKLETIIVNYEEPLGLNKDVNEKSKFMRKIKKNTKSNVIEDIEKYNIEEKSEKKSNPLELNFSEKQIEFNEEVKRKKEKLLEKKLEKKLENEKLESEKNLSVIIKKDNLFIMDIEEIKNDFIMDIEEINNNENDFENKHDFKKFNEPNLLKQDLIQNPIINISSNNNWFQDTINDLLNKNKIQKINNNFMEKELKISNNWFQKLINDLIDKNFKIKIIEDEKNQLTEKQIYLIINNNEILINKSIYDKNNNLINFMDEKGFKYEVIYKENLNVKKINYDSDNIKNLLHLNNSAFIHSDLILNKRLEYIDNIKVFDEKNKLKQIFEFKENKYGILSIYTNENGSNRLFELLWHTESLDFDESKSNEKFNRTRRWFSEHAWAKLFDPHQPNFSDDNTIIREVDEYGKTRYLMNKNKTRYVNIHTNEVKHYHNDIWAKYNNIDYHNYELKKMDFIKRDSKEVVWSLNEQEYIFDNYKNKNVPLEFIFDKFQIIDNDIKYEIELNFKDKEIKTIPSIKYSILNDNKVYMYYLFEKIVSCKKKIKDKYFKTNNDSKDQFSLNIAMTAVYEIKNNKLNLESIEYGGRKLEYNGYKLFATTKY